MWQEYSLQPMQRTGILLVYKVYVAAGNWRKLSHYGGIWDFRHQCIGLTFLSSLDNWMISKMTLDKYSPTTPSWTTRPALINLLSSNWLDQGTSLLFSKPEIKQLLQLSHLRINLLSRSQKLLSTSLQLPQLCFCFFFRANKLPNIFGVQ